jgi:hypothetical protein
MRQGLRQGPLNEGHMRKVMKGPPKVMKGRKGEGKKGNKGEERAIQRKKGPSNEWQRQGRATQRVWGEDASAVSRNNKYV